MVEQISGHSRFKTYSAAVSGSPGGYRSFSLYYRQINETQIM